MQPITQASLDPKLNDIGRLRAEQSLDGVIDCFGPSILVSRDDASIPDISVPAMISTTIRTQLVRILPPLLQNHPFSPGKTRVLRRLWRLTGRLTRYQGSALDDAACASMHVHGRAGKPKQLARNAKNPRVPQGFLERRGQDSNLR